MDLQYKIENQVHDIYYLKNNYKQISRDIEKLKSDKTTFLFDKNITKIQRKSINSLRNSGCKIYEMEFIGNKK